MGELAWPGARGFRVRGCAAWDLRVRGSGPSAPDPLDSLAPTPWSATNQLTNKPAQPAQPAQHLPSSPIYLFRGHKSPICESSYSKEKTRSEDERLRPGLLWKRHDPLDRPARKWLTYRTIFVQGEQISRKKEGRPIGISRNFEEAILFHGGRSPEAGFLSARWHPRARTAYCEIRDARRDDREPPTAQSRSAR